MGEVNLKFGAEDATTKATTTVKGHLREITAELKKLNAAQEKTGTAGAKAASGLKKTTTEAKKARGTFSGLSADADKLVKSFVGLQVLRAVKNQFVDAVSANMEFNQAVRDAGVLSGATGKEFDLLKAKANQLGQTTKFTALEAATAMQEYARAGFLASETTAAMDGTLALAAATGGTLEGSATAMTAAIKSWGLEAGSASRLSDIFTASINNSRFSQQELNEALKFGAPAGAAFGQSVEETVTSMSLLINLLGSGSLAGNAFKQAMSQATRSTKEKVAILKKYGLTMEDINPETHKFTDILQTVGEAGISGGDAMKIFGDRAGTAVATVAARMADGEANAEGLRAKLMETGVAGETAAKRMDTLKGDVELLTSAFDAFRRQTVEGVTPALRYLSQELTTLLSGDALSKWAAMVGLIEKSTVDQDAAKAEKVAAAYRNQAEALAHVRELQNDIANLQQRENEILPRLFALQQREGNTLLTLTGEERAEMARLELLLESTQGRVDKARAGIEQYRSTAMGAKSMIEGLITGKKAAAVVGELGGGVVTGVEGVVTSEKDKEKKAKKPSGPTEITYLQARVEEYKAATKASEDYEKAAIKAADNVAKQIERGQDAMEKAIFAEMARTQAKVDAINEMDKQRVAKEAELSQATQDKAISDAKFVRDSLQTIGIQAGALLMQGIVEGARGEEGAFKRVVKGLLPIIGQVAGLAVGAAFGVPQVGAAIGGAGGGALAGLFHDGGIAGQSNVARAHQGAFVGQLGAGEVPAILQAGEVVASRDSVARNFGSAEAADQALNRGGGMGGTVVNNYISTFDAAGVDHALRWGPIGDSFNDASRSGRGWPGRK